MPYAAHNGLSVAIAGYAGLCCQMACRAQQGRVMRAELLSRAKPQCGVLDSTDWMGVLKSIVHNYDARFAGLGMHRRLRLCRAVHRC